MKLHSPLIGDVEICEEEIYTFAQGIPGFEQAQRFSFIPLPEAAAFTVMQAVDQAQPAFVVLNPFTIYPEYDFKLPPHVLEQLELEGPEDVELYVIVTLGPSLAESTCNLLAPLILNRKKRLGKQVVLEESYSRKAPLIRAQEGAAESC